MAAMTRDNFASLLTPIHRKVFFDNYNSKEKQYTKVFKVDSMQAKDASFPHIAGFGVWNENAEGRSFDTDEMVEVKTSTLSARRYDKAYEVSWELVQDDLYNVMRGVGKGGSASTLGRGLQATEESEAAKTVVDAFGVYAEHTPILNANHTLQKGGTCDNLVVGALSDEKLKEALTKMRMQKDEAGVLIAAHADRLVVHPDWEFTARALLHSTLQAGTSNNDKNTLPHLDLVVWDYLADPREECETVKPWFVQDSSLDNFMFLWREKPIFDSERIENTMNQRFFGYCRFTTGWVDWRGIVGSQGRANHTSV